MNIPKRYREMIIAALIVVVAVLLTMNLGVTPMLNAAASANLGTSQNDAVMNVEISRIHHLQMLTRNDDTVDAQLVQMSESMPEEPKVSAMVDSLNGFANANGLVVTELNVGDPEKYVVPGKIHAQKEFQLAMVKAANNIKDIPVSLTVDGEFDSLLQFMDDLENSPRVTLIKNFEFQRGQTPGNFTLQINAYVFMVVHKP